MDSGDTHDGALALLDRANQPLGTAQAFLDVLSRLGAFGKRLPVEVRNLELGKTVVVGHHEVLFPHLLDVDVGRNVGRFLVGVRAARLGVKPITTLAAS